MKNHWYRTKEQMPTASAGAKLLICEIAELKHLAKLKSFPVRAILLLEESIKRRANEIIQWRAE
jgi:hypothetical protein